MQHKRESEIFLTPIQRALFDKYMKMHWSRLRRDSELYAWLKDAFYAAASTLPTVRHHVMAFDRDRGEVRTYCSLAGVVDSRLQADPPNKNVHVAHIYELERTTSYKVEMTMFENLVTCPICKREKESERSAMARYREPAK